MDALTRNAKHQPHLQVVGNNDLGGQDYAALVSVSLIQTSYIYRHVIQLG